MARDKRNVPAEVDEEEDEELTSLAVGDGEDVDVDEEDLEGGFLDVNLNEVPHLHIAKAGEHPLRCYKAEIRVSKGEKTVGQKMAFLSIEHAEDAAVKELNHVIMLPYRGIDEKSKIKRLNALREACDAFGVDYSNGVRIKEFEGQEGWAILNVTNSPEYGEQNGIQKFITGPGEGGVSDYDEDDDE